jgi:two-component system sensor histidine kinase SenX3
VSLKPIATQAVSQLELAAQNKHMKLDVKVGNIQVLGDDVSLKELLVILVDNAIKYGLEKTTVTVTATSNGKYAELSVADQGPGMKAIDIEHIFDRFYRAESSRSRSHHVEGYGLGLSIAHKIVEAHNGNIEVKSKLGEGSTFTVKLPLAQPEDAS